MARTTTRPQAPGEEQTAWWADPPVVDPERLKAFVARVDAHPWVLNLIIAMSPMIVGLLALLAHGRALRYTESAFAAAGWDGLTLPVDQAGSVARAVLGGTLIASIVGGAMLAYFAAKDGVQRGGSAVAPILITAVPMMWGASQALGDNGQPIGYTLMVGAGLVFVFAVAGLATGLVKRFRPQRVRAGRGEPPRRQGLAGATLVVLTPAIALTRSWPRPIAVPTTPSRPCGPEPHSLISTGSCRLCRSVLCAFLGISTPLAPSMNTHQKTWSSSCSGESRATPIWSRRALLVTALRCRSTSAMTRSP